MGILKQANQKAFTLLELMIVVVMISILASTSATMYESYVRRSKTQEVVLMLPQIANGQVAYYLKESQWIDVGPANIPPSSTKVDVDFSLNNWPAVNVRSSGPILFGYRGYASGLDYVAEGQGDQDGDTDLALFTMNIVINEGRPTRSGLVSIDELE